MNEINFTELRQQLLELHRRELDGLVAFEAVLGRAQQFGLCQDLRSASAPRLVIPHAPADKSKPLALPAPVAPAKRRGRPPRVEAKKEKVAPAKVAGGRKGHRGAIMELFRLVVSDLAEPFTVGSAKTAFVAAHPEHEKWTLNIAGCLIRWHDAGLVERTAGGGTGNPSSYRRTKQWSAGTEGEGRSDRERRYLEFRSNIVTTPTADE